MSKLAAGREKDLEFAGALIDSGLIEVPLLVERARSMADSTVSPELARRILGSARGFLRSGSAGREPGLGYMRPEFDPPTAGDPGVGRHLD